MLVSLQFKGQGMETSMKWDYFDIALYVGTDGGRDQLKGVTTKTRLL